MNAHSRLLAASPIFQSRPEDKQTLILDLVGTLDAHPQGLSVPSLRRAILELRHQPVEWISKELERTLECCGVFQATAAGRYQLQDLRLLEQPVGDLPVVVMDLEATGGRPPLHRFIEVALIRREPDGSEQSYASLANPRRPLPWYVTKITGLTGKEVREAPSLDDVMDEVLPYLEGALLVFHGSGGDLELLNYELHRRQTTLFPNPVMCTIALTRELEPTLTTMGLERVIGHLGFAPAPQHRAMDDALSTLQVYDHYYDRFERAGIQFMVDAAFFQGHLSMPPFLRSNLSVDLLNALPAEPGAYVLWDNNRRVLQSTPSPNLRRELMALFFPDNALDPRQKQVARNARYLDFRAAPSESQAQSALRELLSGGPGAGRGAGRRRRE